MALAALAALVVVLVIGLGLLTLGGNARLSGKRAMRLNGAQAMASAGVEYGYWQRYYNGLLPPYTGSRSLGRGSFTVTDTDNSANIAGTIRVVSTGTQSGDTVKLTRIILVKKTVFDYALCSGSDLSISQPVTTGSGGANGDVRANGNISLAQTGTVINGDATATGSISLKSSTGTSRPGSAALALPTIDSTYYQGIAAAVYTGNQSFSGFFSFPAASGGLYPVILIQGNVTFGNVIVTGVGTLVVTGTVTFSGSSSYVLSTDKLAVLSQGGFINGAPAGSNITLMGYFYAHNSSGTAAFQQHNTGTLTISGGAAADTFSVTDPFVSNHDSAMDGTLGTEMRLPGY